MALPAAHTRFLLFTGKGGVGKTSLSCATGVALADAGKRVLIVSTDPASNLDEVLGVTLRSEPTPIDSVPGLSALNIDPEAAAGAYRERLLAPYRGVLPAAAIASMEEQLSGACTVEIAAFDEFSKLLGDELATEAFDHVIFDTAPTGHTLRLLTLPSAWNDFIGESNASVSCLGPLAGLEKQKALYGATVRRLADARQTTVVLVSRGEASALREAERTRGELAELGVANVCLAINGVLPDDAAHDAIARAMLERTRLALAKLPDGLARLRCSQTPFLPAGTVGLAALRALAASNGQGGLASTPLDRAAAGESEESEESEESDAVGQGNALPGKLDALIDELARPGRGVIMTMGKGGVGKTTIAAAIAVELAARGHAVLLSTTDPAAHVAAAVGEIPDGLTLCRIDPALEVAAYRAEVLERAAKTLDADALALLDEDLRSPCTEEIAVFRAFARAVDGGKDGYVVLDTAPTGHTLLLLDAAQAYHREVLRTQGDMPQAVTQLLPRLRDPEYTRVVVVTLPEATPVHEAERLQRDLARAGITPFAWVINQSLAASATRHPLLVQRGEYERPFIARVATQLARRCALVAWQVQAPVGAQALRHLSLGG